MAPYHLHSFLFFTFLFIATSPIVAQARENRYFSKSTPSNQPTQGEGQQQQPKQEERVDFTPLSAFKEDSQSQEKPSGHGLYSHEFTPFSPTTTIISTETESVPIDLTSFRASANKHNSFTSNDLNSGFSGYGMSDTRLLENGKYFYDVQKDRYHNGLPYNGGTSGSGFHEYPTENSYEDYGNENRYGGYNGNYQNRYGGYVVNEKRHGGYGHNQNGYYQSNYYNQEEQDMFVP
ncbi:unnamed protein product [Victoria cruziana]